LQNINCARCKGVNVSQKEVKDMAEFTVIVGGKAGQGVRMAGTVISKMFRDMGRYVFQMDDYPSLIKGGHNFVAISTSEDKISSHYMKADIVIVLDKRSYEIHKDHVKENGIMVFDESVEGEGISVPIIKEGRQYSNPELISGVSAVAIVSALIGISEEKMLSYVRKEYPKYVEENVSYASTIYSFVKERSRKKFNLRNCEKRRPLLTGNEALALGMALAGLDAYFAYPMTPSTSILHFFAKYERKLKVVVVQPENEIAVANMAIGSAFTGAKTAVASSGGGFALMQEAFSMAGMAEAPVLFIISSRPGPSTGVPTYTEQADLLFAIHQGHGDFPRIVASPGDIEEAFYLGGDMLSIVWRFQTPGIILLDKHLSESRATVDVDCDRMFEEAIKLYEDGEYSRYRITDDGISPLLFPPSKEMIKWNSYEHDEKGITTEDAVTIKKMHEKRLTKQNAIVEHMKGKKTVNVYGEGDTNIFTFGSTTMSVLEAVRFATINARVIQPIYLEPLPKWELEEYRRGIVVEQNSSGQFARLLKEKVGVEVIAELRKYDGRPFDVVELAGRIKEVIG